MDLKLAAARAQESQTEGLIAALGEAFYKEALGVEFFRAAS